MKKGLIIELCAIFAVLGIFAVLHAQDTDLPPADAQQFWTYITETSPYTEWSFFPGHEGIYPGKSPHGAFLKLYGNPIAIEAAKAGKPMPNGAILVKENYGEDQQKLMAITPMYKVQGYNPDGGDWFWAKYGPEGTVEDAGKIDGCIECHKTQKDYIFSKAK